MRKTHLHQNEIRDYLNRAPKKWEYRGGQMLNNTFVRLKWLASIASGTLNDRINRRAGMTVQYVPWKYPIGSAVRRHQRNELRKKGTRSLCHLV